MNIPQASQDASSLISCKGNCIAGGGISNSMCKILDELRKKRQGYLFRFLSTDLNICLVGFGFCLVFGFLCVWVFLLVFICLFQVFLVTIFTCIHYSLLTYKERQDINNNNKIFEQC